MHQEAGIGTINNRDRKKVLYHLQLADILLIVVPMAIVAVSLVLLTLSCGADMLCAGVAVGSLALIFLFCIVYGAFALIVSLLTRRNLIFRIFLVGGLLAIVSGVIVFLALI